MLIINPTIQLSYMLKLPRGWVGGPTMDHDRGYKVTTGTVAQIHTKLGTNTIQGPAIRIVIPRGHTSGPPWGHRHASVPIQTGTNTVQGSGTTSGENSPPKRWFTLNVCL